MGCDQSAVLCICNGGPRMGLDVNHREILLTECAEGGERFEILLQAFSGDHNFFLHMESEIKILDSEIETYYYDLAVPYQVARLLPETDENRTLIIRSWISLCAVLTFEEHIQKNFTTA